MPSWLPSVDYPPPNQAGYWDPVTSTLNWCEEDYYATRYAAEIVNTLTNLLFMGLAVRGIRSCLRNGHDAVFLVSFAGYGLVGTGSFLFHSTLKYPMQLLDELSMIIVTLIMCYATFSHSRSRLFSNVLAAALVGLAAFIALYYHYLQDPTFHQNAYAILTAVVLFRSMFIMERRLRPALAVRGRARARDDATDRRIIGTMWRLIGCGLSVFLGGFVVWSLDNTYCPTIRGWRRELGLPWGILLEGHGWWHLMTGTGAYFYITWGVWLRHCLNGRETEYELRWPGVLSLPECVRVVGGRGAEEVGGLREGRREKTHTR